MIIKIPTDNPYLRDDEVWVLNGEIGRGKCDHDICGCGTSLVDANGYWRSIVEHSGVWQVVRLIDDGGNYIRDCLEALGIKEK